MFWINEVVRHTTSNTDLLESEEFNCFYLRIFVVRNFTAVRSSSVSCSSCSGVAQVRPTSKQCQTDNLLACTTHTPAHTENSLSHNIIFAVRRWSSGNWSLENGQQVEFTAERGGDQADRGGHGMWVEIWVKFCNRYECVNNNNENGLHKKKVPVNQVWPWACEREKKASSQYDRVM